MAENPNQLSGYHGRYLLGERVVLEVRLLASASELLREHRRGEREGERIAPIPRRARTSLCADWTGHAAARTVFLLPLTYLEDAL